VANSRPAIVKPYGEFLWMDPGEAAAADQAVAVIIDVVRRYDIDGVHIDDYFYPYPVKDTDGRDVPFPDDASWNAYVASGGRLELADWRRGNVDALVERLYREVRRENDRVRVGVSPFGIGRPDRRPPGVTGFSQYDAIYANVERWLENGWMDYLAPQLYWKGESPGQPFEVLLDYCNRIIRAASTSGRVFSRAASMRRRIPGCPRRSWDKWRQRARGGRTATCISAWRPSHKTAAASPIDFAVSTRNPRSFRP
jgi:uncharacterized lipoprotein YddW (UPF0748 family)